MLDTPSDSWTCSTFLPVGSSQTTNESGAAVASRLPSADRSESRIQPLWRNASLPHQNGRLSKVVIAGAVSLDLAGAGFGSAA